MPRWFDFCTARMCVRRRGGPSMNLALVNFRVASMRVRQSWLTLPECLGSLVFIRRVCVCVSRSGFRGFSVRLTNV